MRLTLMKEDGILTARLSGELDQHSAAQVRRELDRALGDPSVKRIEFDMKEVSFMDSAGIGVILGRYRTVSGRGGSMGIGNAPRNVERILRMSGVYTLATERSMR
ncbi:MAG: anti-sigma factor antagonist [Clostridia bacterium]|nr:anti-sigma factor antagonist [Clostridia bacterium]